MESRKTMAKGRAASIDEYIGWQPKPVQAVLKRVRQTIQKAVPAAEETISYSMPAFRYRGRVMMFFAAWQEHYAIYPSNPRLVAAFKKELAPYELDRGTIRFPLEEPVPAKLIAGIARFLARETAARELARKGAKRR
jgi:uncharacterized protein YdhG (YjbR/CyaY superfamily)